MLVGDLECLFLLLLFFVLISLDYVLLLVCDVVEPSSRSCNSNYTTSALITFYFSLWFKKRKATWKFW